MKAIVRDTYGSADILRLQDTMMPTPKDNEVRIHIRATSINAGDRHMLHGSPLPVRFVSGLRRPKHPILGSDVVGRIDAIGSNVTHFKAGDVVLGDVSNDGFGAFAEYVCANETAVVAKPANVTCEQAAAVPVAAIAALQGLQHAGPIRTGQRVLINGAAGGVGTFAVQIAKASGAEVTGVCSARNVELVRSIGADNVIDYTTDDFTTQGRHYDVILDTAAHRSMSDYQRALAPGGTYVMVGGSARRLFQVMLTGPWRSRRAGQRFRTFIVQPRQKDLAFVADLLATGAIAPIIDRTYPLDEVPEALRYVERGQARGKVVITI